MSDRITYSIGVHGLPPLEIDGGVLAVRSCAVPDVKFTEEGARSTLVIDAGIRTQGTLSVQDCGKPVYDELLVTAKKDSAVFLTLPSVCTLQLKREISLNLDQGARATIVILLKGSGEMDISLKATLAQSAELTILQVFQEGKYVRYKEEIILSGDDAGAHVLSVLSPGSDCSYDLATHIVHKGDRSRGHVRALGVFRHRSKVVYRVTGDILSGVADADSSEEARFVILHPEADIAAIPSLDIASNKVRTSHKLSMYELGDELLFYPKSRGYTDKDARDLYLEGLLSSELSCIKNDVLVRELIQSIIYA
jgi:hypothetical protein